MVILQVIRPGAESVRRIRAHKIVGARYLSPPPLPRAVRILGFMWEWETNVAGLNLTPFALK